MSRASLCLFLLAGLVSAAAADDSWKVRFEPFETYRYGDGLLELKRPAGWKVKVGRSGQEEQLLLYPADADPLDPHTAYLLLMVRLPDGKLNRERVDATVPLVTDRVKDRLVAADSTGRTQVTGKPRDGTFAGRPAREWELLGVAGQRATRTVLRGTVNARVALTMIQVWPADSKLPYRKLYRLIDGSLKFGKPAAPKRTGKPVPFIGHGWMMRIPEDWTGSPMTFSGRPAYTLAHKRLLTTRDPRALRMIVSTLQGEKLAAHDAAGLARNVALNLQKQNPALVIRAAEKGWKINGLPAARLKLDGKMKQSALEAGIWVVAIKADRRAYLLLVLAGRQRLAAQSKTLERTIRSFQLLSSGAK